MSWPESDLPPHPALVRFGQNVRRARQIAGVTQQRLADLSGVSQSVISRLERAQAPRFALDRLLLLHDVLGAALPLAECPHDHHCIWSPLTESGERSHTDALRRGMSYWERRATSRRA